MYWTTAFAVLVSSSLGAAHPLQERRADGCGQKPTATPGSLTPFTIKQGSDTRHYQVWLPEDYDRDAETSLILSYHGANRVIKEQVALDRLTEPLFNTDHIVVYLQGTAKDDADRPDHTTWEGSPGSESDDIDFTSDVLDAMEADYCVDTSRIYATGKSQGGGFVGRLACHQGMSKRIAAFAPVSGAYYVTEGIDEEADCNPMTVELRCNASRTDIPIMAFHGGNDGTINYHGGFRSGACLPDISSWARRWAVRDGLDGTPSNKTIAKSNEGVVMSYGDDGLVTLVYDGKDVGHDWPSTTENSDNDREGGVLAAFNASEWIMTFFKKHSLS